MASYSVNPGSPAGPGFTGISQQQQPIRSHRIQWATGLMAVAA
jgi:hypothetical protein